MSRPNDPNTKPSRLNRKRKKRWKIADLIEIGLTDCARVAMLIIAGNSQPGTLNPESKGVKAPIQGVFYCPKKIVAPMVRAFVMVACIGPLSSGPEPLPGVENPMHVAAQRLSTFGGGLFILSKGQPL
ncbi:hypothetical protein QZJ86_05745 [Methylomonas montana]|uniref:hypothetical protein n=1 Tax=Methylomonas montana TaxID=3058963 RepID=UPI00265A4000|nr:hypothetical protein [Methylomonas montana]WKJ91637.1 hypothetical protein QZJ86_05745 [Methylomonas montana]